MSVVVTIFPQPKVYLSLESGGTLTVGQEYFFIGFFSKGSSYYGNSTGTISEEISITPTSGNQSIKAEWWQDGGDYTQVVQNGSDITISATAHGRSVSDTVYLRGGAYDGTYTIQAVTTNTFDVTATYSADDTGKWFADIGKPEYSDQIVFKWDKYSMINSGTSKPYQWLNMNDPANTGSEWDGTYGHRKWSTAMYRNTPLNGTDTTWIKEATTWNINGNELHDGAVAGGGNYSTITQPQVALRDNSSYYQIDSHFPRDTGTLCVMFDGAGSYGTDDLMNALLNSPYTDHYQYSNKSNGYNIWQGSPSITIFGSMFSNYTDNTELADLQLTLVGGQAFSTSYSNRVTIKRCTLNTVGIANYFWYNPRIEAIDSVTSHVGNAFILDNLSGSGITPKIVGSALTFYGSADGFDMIGGNSGGYPYFQYRYYNASQTFTNMLVKDFYVYATARSSGATDTMTWTNVEFANNGLKDYDIYLSYGYMDDLDIDETFACTDVSSNRDNGQIIVYYVNLGDPTSYSSVWKSRYAINLTVVDGDNNPINGATVTLNGEENSSDTTDVDGKASVSQLGYTITAPAYGGNPYQYGINSSWYTADLTISHASYGTYKLKNIEIKSGKNWRIKLPSSGTQTKIYDSNLYDSTIY